MRESSESAHTDDPMKDVATERAEPSPPVEQTLPDQTPPPGFEPQTGLGEGQVSGVQERPADSTEEVEAEVDDDEATADDDDDAAEDGEPSDDHPDD